MGNKPLESSQSGPVIAQLRLSGGTIRNEMLQYITICATSILHNILTFTMTYKHSQEHNDGLEKDRFFIYLKSCVIWILSFFFFYFVSDVRGLMGTVPPRPNGSP